MPRGICRFVYYVSFVWFGLVLLGMWLLCGVFVCLRWVAWCGLLLGFVLLVLFWVCECLVFLVVTIVVGYVLL